MSNPCLVVLTARGFDRIRQEGGSQAWRLNPTTAGKFAYCVCVQNRNGGSWGAADRAHHTAFMIGRIKEVILSQEDNDKTERYFVVFSEYAEISHEDAWPGNRNPVRYSDLSEFGVDDPDALIWHPMHQPTPQRQQASASTQVEDHGVVGPLTIPEARVALAVGLGVPESAIEITVRY